MNTTTTVARYAVRPTRTIRNWFIWAVLVDADGKETWAPTAYRTVVSKFDARALVDSLNKGLKNSAK